MKQYKLQQIIPLLFATTNKIQKNCDKIFEKITTRQFMTILTICHIKPDECTFNRLAEQMGTTKQNVAQIVHGLYKRGIVDILENPSDKRSKLIAFTEEGIEIAKNSMNTGNEIIDNMKQSFSEKELDELYQLLSKLYSYDGELATPLHSDNA